MLLKTTLTVVTPAVEAVEGQDASETCLPAPPVPGVGDSNPPPFGGGGDSDSGTTPPVYVLICVFENGIAYCSLVPQG